MDFYKETEFKNTQIGEVPQDWDVVKIRHIGEVITGTTPRTAVKEYWDGSIPFVTPTDISESKYVYHTERKVTERGAQRGRVIPRDSVLVTCIASIGKVALAYEKCITNQQINAVICLDKIDPHYVYYTMTSRTKGLRDEAGATTSAIIKKSLFEEFFLPAPKSKNEQQKIASILSAVDEAIQKTNEVIQKTQELKKGLMQELLTKGIGIKGSKFSKELNAEIPKEWEVMQVKDLGKVITGTTPRTKINDYWDGAIPFVTPTDLSESKYVCQTERRVTEKGAEEGRVIPKDSVLVTCIASVGKVALAYEECITNQQINAIICKEEMNPDYVYYVIGFRKKALRDQAGATTNAIVKKSLFEKFLVPIPKSQSEQQKIAEILSSVDEKIEEERRTKEQLGKLKKGLMQILLTGKVRIRVN